MEKKLYESKMDVLTIFNKIGISDVYFGIEIEIEFLFENHRNIFIDLFYNKFTHFLLKKEMSITCGVEIVSAPMTLDIMATEINEVILFCNEHNAQVSERTGLHIHITKTNDPQVDLHIFQFVNNPKHREEIIDFSGRLSPFARYTTRLYPHNNSRGYSINLKNKHTIEFRIFKLKLNYEWILGRIFFCDIIRTNIKVINRYYDLINIAENKYPVFFVNRLKHVKKTELNKTYPIIYPISDYMQFW